MRVALIGGTGFVGGYLVDALLGAGHLPVLLVRPERHRPLHRGTECSIVVGDVTNIDDLRNVMRQADATIFNIGILRESPGVSFEALQWRAAEHCIAAAGDAGVRRFLLMSANGVHERGTLYQRTKFLAEAALGASGLDGTIFRPSVIFGDPRGADEIATRLLREMVLPPLPAVAFQPGLLPAANALPMSPVHVADVAAAFVTALDDPAAIGRTFTLAGPEAIGWREMIERVANAVGRRKVFVPMPIGLMKVAAFALDRFSWFPVTREQLTMLAQGNVADPQPLARLLGRAPVAFDAANLAYLAKVPGV